MAEPHEDRVQHLRRQQEAWCLLLRRIEERDDTALTALYDETSAAVYTVALRILDNAADAEEITLDVYTYVWHSAGTFDSSRGTVMTWLTMLARSRASERLRKAGNRIGSIKRLPTEDPTSGTSMGQRDQSILIGTALRQLCPKDQELIRSAFFQGLSHPELAVALGMPLGTVKSRIRAILFRLRDLLD
jgi:RNA polymerase sigma-70 factor (ECF subfamily)